MKRAVFFLLLLFIGCKQQGEVVKPPPVELTRADSCRVCGMIIVDFPGPKAQIHYKNGHIDKFCSVVEMMTFYLQPDRPPNIAAIYVQDMAKADWKHPIDHWIEAESAYFVYGADIYGPMGQEIVPFSTEEDAREFIKKKGGRIVRFQDIKMDMLRPKVIRPQTEGA